MRSSIGINDDSPFPGKALENTRLNTMEDRLDSVCIIVSRQAYQDIDLAYIDELAKKIICQNHVFRQFNPRAKPCLCQSRSHPTGNQPLISQIRRSRNQ